MAARAHPQTAGPHNSTTHGGAVPQSCAQRDAGFTLVELLTVMVVIGVLAAVAVPTYLAARQRAHDASLKSDLLTVAKSLDGQALESTLPPSDSNGTGWVPAGTTPGSSVSTSVRLSPGTTLNYRRSADGYCLAAYDPAATASGPNGGGYLWYSSVDGGLAPERATSLPAGLRC